MNDDKPSGFRAFQDGFAESEAQEPYADAGQLSQEEDYYSLLALPRDPPPTTSQVRAAYHALSLSFHPDKQMHADKEAATRHYAHITAAYEVLNDPRKRVVYDLLGIEGLKAEFSNRGLMGPDGEKLEVGVRAMSEREFRTWFLRRMKARERKAVEELVQSKGMIRLNVDATSMIGVDPWGNPFLQLPTFKPTSYAFTHRFRTPFSPLTWCRDFLQDYRNLATPEKDAELDDAQAQLPESSLEPECPLQITANVGGEIRPIQRTVRLLNPETQKTSDRIVPFPPVLLSRGFGLAATLQHFIRGGDLTANSVRRRWLSCLEDSLIVVQTTILPLPQVEASIAKTVSPVAGANPMALTLSSVFAKSPIHVPPYLSASVRRQFGSGRDARRIGYANVSSGQLFWPELLQAFFMKASKIDSNKQPIMVSTQTSRFTIGYDYAPLPPLLIGHSARQTDEKSAFLEKSDPRETWGFQLNSSPATVLDVSLSYGRTLFPRKTGPSGGVLTQWTEEGYHPRRTAYADYGAPIRLECHLEMGVTNTSPSCVVQATRRVTEFTKLGLGVSVIDGQGISMSLSWQRLGQKVQIPILMLPFEFTTTRTCAWAFALPCVLYSILEIGILRPRELRRQRRHLAGEMRRLKKATAQTKEESENAVTLMRNHVLRQQKRESDRNGLVIESAQYGHGKDVIDVTIPLAALVHQSQLILSEQVVKWQIIGFYDPAPLRSKKLRVRYHFEGRSHYVEVDDREKLVCPMRKHMVE